MSNRKICSFANFTLDHPPQSKSLKVFAIRRAFWGPRDCRNSTLDKRNLRKQIQFKEGEIKFKTTVSFLLYPQGLSPGFSLGTEQKSP